MAQAEYGRFRLVVGDVHPHPRLNPDPFQPQACGDYNGQLAIHDLERNDVPVWSAKAHKSIINAVDGLGGPDSTYGAPELVSLSSAHGPNKRKQLDRKEKTD